MCVDLLSFCILAGTCFETSAEICLDHVVLSVPWGFLIYEGLCDQDCFVATHSIHSIVCTLVSCIQDVYGNVGVPQFCQCLVLHHSQQLLQ